MDDAYIEDDSQEQEFANYVPTTVNKSPWVLIGTMIICFLLFILSVIFLVFRSRRRQRKAKKRFQRMNLERWDALRKKAEEMEQKSSVEVEFMPKKRPLRLVGQRNRGWREIFVSIEDESSTIKKKWRRFSLRSKKPQTADDLLGRDLFDAGGIMHQLYVTFGGELNPEELPDTDGDDRSGDDTASTASEMSKNTSLDYALMETNQQPSAAPPSINSSFAYLCSLFRRDREMSEILRLAIPYSMSSMIYSICRLLTLVIIGKLLGTRALSAFVMVVYMVEISTMFLDGIVSSLTTVCSQALGSENYILAGQYTQMAIMLYELLFLPQIFIWWNYVDNLMLFLEFDEESAAFAQSYARIHVLALAFKAIQQAFSLLLQVSGYERFSTVADSLQAVTLLLTIFCVSFLGRVPIVGRNTTLRTVGFLELIVQVVFLCGKLIYMRRETWWWNTIWPGLTGHVAFFNFSSFKFFLKTAIPLSVGFVLCYGEWEVLFILAGTLGPAEAAAWGILGEIWGAFENLTYACGDAAEVRCAQLLGAGNPEVAELSAHKSLALGTACSVVTSLALIACMGRLPSWITNDVTLQSMVNDLLPLVALGNVTLTLGTISWQLVGAQARYSLATAVQFIGSWLVTLPLAILSSVYLHWDLQGLVASVVIGYMVSGMLNFVVMCCTNWERRSARIITQNAEMADEQQDGFMSTKTEHEHKVAVSDGVAA